MARRLLLVALTIIAGLVAWVAWTRGPAAPTAPSGEAFSFAVLGDSPYSGYEDLQYRIVLDDIAAHDLSFVIHVGDFMKAECTDARYLRTLDQFNALPHPVIYTPGDNEWTDCWAEGNQEPLTQLARIREVFFQDPSMSLGGRTLPLQHQGLDGAFVEFPENARWAHEGVLFATMHLVGSDNGLADSPGRTEAGDAEAARRLDAAVAWLRATFEAARSTETAAVVIVFHANPGFENPEARRREILDPFIAALEEEAAGFGGPVLAMHGDWHDFIVDQPVTSRITGQHLDNLTRLQVPGSFEVGWVRATFTPGADEPFAFEPRVVPRWKFW